MCPPALCQSLCLADVQVSPGKEERWETGLSAVIRHMLEQPFFWGSGPYTVFSLSLTHTHTLFLSLSLSLFLSLTHTHTHTLPLALTHSLSLSHTHTHTHSSSRS